jgi:hypothetical protein
MSYHKNLDLGLLHVSNSETYTRTLFRNKKKDHVEVLRDVTAPLTTLLHLHVALMRTAINPTLLRGDCNSLISSALAPILTGQIVGIGTPRSRCAVCAPDEGSSNAVLSTVRDSGDIGGELLLHRSRLLWHYTSLLSQEHEIDPETVNEQLRRYQDIAAENTIEAPRLLEKLDCHETAQLSRQLGLFHDERIAPYHRW